MPKETIVNTQREVVHIGWTKDCDVQLGTLPPDDLPAAMGGYYVTLNRSEINRVIRALREARDSAYGRDA